MSVSDWKPTGLDRKSLSETEKTIDRALDLLIDNVKFSLPDYL